MQDWLMVLTPITTVLYFAINPSQLKITMDWIEAATAWCMRFL